MGHSPRQQRHREGVAETVETVKGTGSSRFTTPPGGAGKGSAGPLGIGFKNGTPDTTQRETKLCK